VSEPLAINNENTVVGWSYTSGGAARSVLEETLGFDGVTPKSLWRERKRHAFIWNGSTMIDLNESIAEDMCWELLRANDINDAGYIVGEGIVNGQAHAYLLELIESD